MTDATTITVSGDASYDIVVGRGILSSLGEALPPAARRCS
jgi:3-dehydroquinate synthase